MDGPPAQSLGVEPVDSDVLKKKPRKTNESMIDLSLIGNILILSSILVGAFVFDDFKTGLLLITITQVIFTSFILIYFYNISKTHHG